MTIPVGYVLRPTARDEEINACIDAYLLAQRKAEAWDQLQALASQSSDPAGPLVVRFMSQILEN